MDRSTMFTWEFMSNNFRKILIQYTISGRVCTTLGMAQQLAKWFNSVVSLSYQSSFAMMGEKCIQVEVITELLENYLTDNSVKMSI